MKPCLFPPGCVGIVVNSLAIDSSPACSVRTGWQAGAAPPASGNAARPLQGACAPAGAHRDTGWQRAARIPCGAPGYALARRKNPSVSSGTLWIGIGIRPGQVPSGIPPNVLLNVLLTGH